MFTLPARMADIAWQNKAVIYDLLLRAASETMLTIAADPRHLGARIGITAVLHTWGSAMTHHPHVHMIVPGGGLSLDGKRWVACRPGFLLPVRVLSRLFRRLFLSKLADAHAAGHLQFFGDQEGLSDRRAFAAVLAPLRRKNWFVYAKPPFAGPEAVLAYLSRYTHRVAISNSRLISLDERGVTFRCKDYRRNGADRYQVMTLDAGEFIRRFLLHVLPKGFHRIRHYGLLASAGRKANILRARALLAVPEPEADCADTDKAGTAAPTDTRPRCPCCGGRMIVLETFARGPHARAPPWDANAMSSNHSPDCTAAEAAHHRRPDRSVQLSLRASVLQVATLKSSGLRRPHRNRRGLHAPWPPAEDLRPSRQTRLSGHSGPGGTVKSP